MYKKILFQIGLIVLSLSIWGCVATTTSTAPVATAPEKGLTLSPPDRTIGDLSQQPLHIKLVLAALVNKLRGDRDAIPEVGFDPKGKHFFYDPNFTFEDFDLRLVQITGFEIQHQSDAEAKLAVEGVFNFKDLFGRGAAVYFAAGYTVHKNGITISHSGTAPVAPAIPDIELFYVPKSSFSGADVKGISSYMDLYLHALLSAVVMEPTAEERQKMEAYEKTKTGPAGLGNEAKPEDFYIFAFCKDRLPWEASLEMKITDQPGMKGKPVFETGYVYDQGWRVMMAGGVFSPQAAKDNFYIDILYNTNPETKPACINIGSYTNRKNDRTTPQYNIKPVGISMEPAQALAGPIESGTLFLDPNKKADAVRIQTRLTQTGHYKKAIDGAFGESSKAALRSFRKANGLGDNLVWDLNTQKMLFKNSGL
jgi:hypothetical protein